VKRTTFGALPMGAMFFYRSRFYVKRSILLGDLSRVVGARAIEGPMARVLSPTTPVWVEE